MRGGYRYSQYQDGQTLWQVKEQEFADKLLNDGQPTPPQTQSGKTAAVDSHYVHAI